MEGNPPVVIPVKDPDPVKSNNPPLHPNLPQCDGFGGGALVLLVSPVRTGKSTLISNMLLNDQFYDVHPDSLDVLLTRTTIMTTQL